MAIWRCARGFGRDRRVERIVEQVGGVEAGIAEHALRVDRQPAARPEHDVVVVQVAMQRADVVRIGEQPLGDLRRPRHRGWLAGVAVGLGLPEQAAKRSRSGCSSAGRGASDGESRRASTSAAISVAASSPCSCRFVEQHAARRHIRAASCWPSRSSSRTAPAVAPAQVMRAAQLVIDIANGFRSLTIAGLPSSSRTFQMRLEKVSAIRTGSLDLPAAGRLALRQSPY